MEGERMMLSEHDLEERVCVFASSLLLTCHWLLADAGADREREGEDMRCSAIWRVSFGHEGLEKQGHRPVE